MVSSQVTSATVLAPMHSSGLLVCLTNVTLQLVHTLSMNATLYKVLKNVNVYIYMFIVFISLFFLAQNNAIGKTSRARRWNSPKIPNEPSYVILNTAVSSSWGFPIPPIEASALYRGKRKQGGSGDIGECGLPSLLIVSLRSRIFRVVILCHGRG